MNIVLTANQFKKEHVYFYQPIENTIMENSKFVKLLYSNDLFILNGLYLLLNISVNNRENYFKKIKHNFDIELNKHFLTSIYNIEKMILNNYNNNNDNDRRSKKFCIYDSLSSGFYKTFPIDTTIINNNNTFILKISGIWENETEYGLTFKIINN